MIFQLERLLISRLWQKEYEKLVVRISEEAVAASFKTIFKFFLLKQTECCFI
jgi:hypothetical protein